MLGSIIGAGIGGTLGGLGSALGGWGASRRAARERRRIRKLVGWATTTAKEDVTRATTGAPYTTVQSYYKSMFEKGIPDVMAQDYSARMRLAQESRGMGYGGAAMKAEALGLTKLAEQGRAAAAPAYLQFATMPLQIEQQAFGLRMGQTGLAEGVANMGPSPLEIAGQAMSSFLQGAMGGMMAGTGMGGGGMAGLFGGGAGGGGGGGGGGGFAGAAPRLNMNYGGAAGAIAPNAMRLSPTYGSY